MLFGGPGRVYSSPIITLNSQLCVRGNKTNVLAAPRWPLMLSLTSQLRKAEKAVFAYCMRKKSLQCSQVTLTFSKPDEQSEPLFKELREPLIN